MPAHPPSLAPTEATSRSRCRSGCTAGPFRRHVNEVTCAARICGAADLGLSPDEDV